jgi:hypothetical protein
VKTLTTLVILIISFHLYGQENLNVFKLGIERNNSKSLIAKSLQLLSSDLQVEDLNYLGDSLLAVSIQSRTSKDLDIYLLNPKSKEKKQLFALLEDERDLRSVPNTDEHSVIIGRSMNTGIYRILDLGQYFQFKSVVFGNRISSHLWLDSIKLVYLTTDGTNTEIRHYNSYLDIDRKLISKAGKSIYPGKDDYFYYLDYFSTEYHYLKEYNLRNSSSKIICRVPEKVEYFAILEGKTFIIADGLIIKKFEYGKDAEWKILTDLSTCGISNINSISGNMQHSIFLFTQ